MRGTAWIVLAAVLQGNAAQLTQYAWGTSLDSIKRRENIAPMENGYLKDNLKRLFQKKEVAGFSLFLNAEKTIPIDGREFRQAFGFHAGKLFYTIHFTDEMSFQTPLKFEEAMKDSLYWKIYGQKPSSVMVIINDVQEGTIFHEGGMSQHGEFGDDLVELQICVGAISKPTHLQFFVFEFDKRRLKEFGDKGLYKIDKPILAKIPPQHPFTRIVSKTYLKELKQLKP